MISRLLLILALAVLAYIVYITMTSPEKFSNKKAASIPVVNKKQENFTQVQHKPVNVERPVPNVVQHVPKVETFIPTVVQHVPKINYETFADAPGAVEVVPNVRPAAFKDKKVEDDGLYATVNYTGLVDANPNDSLQIEGTDLLTAPLVDNMLYTNSISNVNRNASQDLRGDISVQFDKNYTPFYTSTIAGVDRLGGSMNIGRAAMTIPAVAV